MFKPMNWMDQSPSLGIFYTFLIDKSADISTHTWISKQEVYVKSTFYVSVLDTFQYFLIA